MRSLLGLLFSALLVIGTSPAANMSAVSPKPIYSGNTKIPGNQDMVRLLRCGRWAGTGQPITETKVYTALHVTGGAKTCVDTATNQEGTVIYTDEQHDVAVVEFSNLKLKPIAYSCEGFQDDTVYYMYGYAHGHRPIYISTIYATFMVYNPKLGDGTVIHEMRGMLGQSFHGMSGGAIVDQHGVMVGSLQAGNEVAKVIWARDLRDTYLCKKR